MFSRTHHECHCGSSLHATDTALLNHIHPVAESNSQTLLIIATGQDVEGSEGACLFGLLNRSERHPPLEYGELDPTRCCLEECIDHNLSGALCLLKASDAEEQERILQSCWP